MRGQLPFAGLLLIGLSGQAPAQEVEGEVLRTDYLGHEIILLEDGTWRFVAPGTTLASANSADTCLSLEALKIALCGLGTDWAQKTAVDEPGYSAWDFASREDEWSSLQIGFDMGYGHEGTPELFMSESPLVDGIVGLVARVSGLETTQYRSFLVDGDLLVDEMLTVDIGYGSYYLTMMGESDLLDISVTHLVDVGTFGQASAEDTRFGLSGQIDKVHARIEIGGRSFTDILQDQGLEALHGERKVE